MRHLLQRKSDNTYPHTPTIPALNQPRTEGNPRRRAKRQLLSIVAPQRTRSTTTSTDHYDIGPVQRGGECGELSTWRNRRVLG